MSLLTFTDKGIYCARANVYIDPWKKVDYALITHAHSDHARRGSKKYLATHLTVPVLKHRLGQKQDISGIAFGEKISLNGVQISFHPAGHIIGSAQIRCEFKGEIWVVSGDYKIEDDGLTTPFEPVRCTHFITESTFGLPIYQWRPQNAVMSDMHTWWSSNASNGKISVLNAYSLGKAQRLAFLLDDSIGQIYLHRSVYEIHEIFRKEGVHLKQFPVFEADRAFEIEPGSMIIGPSGILDSKWNTKVEGIESASASGWMQVRNIRRRRILDRGFVLSDHADWPGLLNTIKNTGAEHIFVTHGYTDSFSRYLRETGLSANIVQTKFSAIEND